MRLFRQLTTTKAPGGALGPLRIFATAASVGLLAGWGAVAVGAIPAIAAQDQDPEENVKVEVKRIQSDGGENIEVIVVGEDGVDHKALLKKLKEKHGIDIKNLHGDQGQNVEVEVIVDGEGKSNHQALLKKLKTKRNVELKKLHGDQGQNVEVEVFAIDDGDANHQDVLKKLKTKHNIDVEKLHVDHGGNVDVFVVKDDNQHVAVLDKIHGQAAKFVLQKAKGKSNHHDLANQLRAIADQLDGKNLHSAHPNVKLNRKIEVHRSGDHDIRVFKHKNQIKKNNQVVDLSPDSGKRLRIVKSGEPHEVILDVSPEGPHAVHGKQERLLLQHAKELASAHGVIVKDMRGPDHDHGHAHEHESSGGKTSAESGVSTLEDLKSELEALRKDLQKLRSKRKPQQKQRLQRKKAQSSSSDKAENRFIWVADDDEKKPGNTFVWKSKDEEVDQVGPNRFRIEFQHDDSDDDDSDDDDSDDDDSL